MKGLVSDLDRDGFAWGETEEGETFDLPSTIIVDGFDYEVNVGDTVHLSDDGHSFVLEKSDYSIAIYCNENENGFAIVDSELFRHKKLH